MSTYERSNDSTTKLGEATVKLYDRKQDQSTRTKHFHYELLHRTPLLLLSHYIKDPG